MKPETVDWLFSRMTLAYGTRFRAQWNGMADSEVKGVWFKELRGLSEEQVRYGINNLPGKHPPNAMEFKAICREYVAPKVMEKPASFEGVKPPKRVLEGLGGVGRGGAGGGPLAWAVRLRDREQRGERLTGFQAKAWRRALPQSSSERSIPNEINGLEQDAGHDTVDSTARDDHEQA